MLAAMNVCFYSAIDRLPLGTVAAIEFLPVIALAAFGARTARNLLALGLAVGGVWLLTDVRLAGAALGFGFAFANALLFAAVVTNVSALPVGTILDAYGPRVSGIIGSIFLALGATTFALAKQLPFDGYIPGYLLLSLGGPFVFISSFQLSNTFPKRSGLILSMLTGAFDASSALFLFFRLLTEHTNGLISTRTFFLTYLFVPVFIITVQLTIMPSTSYKTAGELVQQASAQVVDELQDRIDDRIHDRTEGERQRTIRREHRQSIVGVVIVGS